MSVAEPSLRGGRWLLVSPWSRAQFADPSASSAEPSLVVYDNLGAGVGQTIGYVEGREAAQPFSPAIPIDAVNAALVDQVFYNPFK